MVELPLPRVITPEPTSTTLRVGCLEIPTTLIGRLRKQREDPPILSCDPLTIERRADGRLLCYIDAIPDNGTGCRGCKWSEARDSGACRFHYDAAYGNRPLTERKQPAVRVWPPRTAEQKERRRMLRRGYDKRFNNEHHIANLSPEDAEIQRAKWRRKKARQVHAKRMAKLAGNIPPDTEDNS